MPEHACQLDGKESDMNSSASHHVMRALFAINRMIILNLNGDRIIIKHTVKISCN